MARISYLCTLPADKPPDESSRLDFLATNLAFFGSGDGDRDADGKKGTGMRTKKGARTKNWTTWGWGWGCGRKKGDGDADEKSNHVNGPDEGSAMRDKKMMEAFLQVLKETGSTGEVARVTEVSR